MDADAIAQFAGITGSTDHIAAQYLGFAEGNTEQAIELFYANEGADLEASSTHTHHPQVAPPIPPPSTRPSGHRQGYEDDEGIVHIDSDPEDQDYVDDDGDVQITDRSRRQRPTLGRPDPSSRGSGHATPSTGEAGIVDDDEAMARRLQEEFYGASARSGGYGNSNSHVVDEHGYRAPMGRTTETLVGPGSFDPSNPEEMRAAVLDQMMARRQQPRQRGKLRSQGC